MKFKKSTCMYFPKPSFKNPFLTLLQVVYQRSIQSKESFNLFILRRTKLLGPVSGMGSSYLKEWQKQKQREDYSFI